MTPAIQIQNLALEIDGAVVLNQLNLTAQVGTVAAIVGRAHTGKSALLRTLLGRGITPGSVSVHGLDAVAEGPVVRGLTTWVDRCGVLETHLTVRQNVALALRLSRTLPAERARVDRGLRESDLPDRAFDVRAELLTPRETLSVWLAIARLRCSTIVLLDDPTALLKPNELARTAVLIRELCVGGVTVLATTQDRRFADAVADSVYSLEEGQLVDGRQWRGLLLSDTVRITDVFRTEL